MDYHQEFKRDKDRNFIRSDTVVEFLESRTQLYDFDHLGYEVKSVENIDSIFLVINPDPLNFSLIPEDSLVITHHKISTHKNRIYSTMLDQARKDRYSIFNFHLGWDIMPGGIGDSFLRSFGLSRSDFQKVDLTYRGHAIKNLGAIVNHEIPIDNLVKRLTVMNVDPSVIINPQCKSSRIGYIPGGGFVDQMIIEMADLGVDTLISSDPNWVVETIAREVGVTLIGINHYISERYGLQSMKTLLTKHFPEVDVHILENIDNIGCSEEGYAYWIENRYPKDIRI